jgi:ferrous iron transport protein B
VKLIIFAFPEEGRYSRMKATTLDQLKSGEKGILTKIKGRGAFRKRVMEMGFVRGKTVTVIKSAPLLDPIEYKILDYKISLRRNEASLIEVIPEKEFKELPSTADFTDKQLPSEVLKAVQRKGMIIDVALVGNPNCGKTSIFNYASHSREHVGNYAGVTVESKKAVFRQKGYTLNLTDLPGTYSLSTYSPEELFVRNNILNDNPDVVLNVVDASNLERNLFLTTQLIDMDIRVVIALNMYDDLEKGGAILDYEHLGRMIGIPIIPTVGTEGKGIEELFDRIIEVYEGKETVSRHIHINYGKEIERSLKKLQDLIWQSPGSSDTISSRFYAIKLIEKDEEAISFVKGMSNGSNIVSEAYKEVDRLEKALGESTDTLLADAKYGFIAGALKETLKPKEVRPEKLNPSERIDRVLTNKWAGLPIFLFFLWLMFQTTFNVGKYPVDWIEAGVSWLSGVFNSALPAGILRDFLVDGIVGGVGGVIVFLPNILILFFFISLMEDTGYMARVAFIMDKLMHLMGLHGKSFIPLIMGFGCNVPAIMATRTIENRSDRLLTMLILPFMSCSARLPVYILIAALINPGQAGNMIFGIYLAGIVLSVIVAIFFKKTMFKHKEAPFVMELPPYRVPKVNTMLKHVWFRGQLYLKKMGGVILIASALIWALSYFPRSEGSKTEQLESSFIGMIGKAVQPVIQPLGFDWKMGVSLITGIAAKEVVVSTMGVLYQEDDPYTTANLTDKLRAEVHETGPYEGEPVYTSYAALAFLLFVLIYVPCVAVLAAIRREAGGWKWAALLGGYTTVMAWVVSMAVFQIGRLIHFL